MEVLSTLSVDDSVEKEDDGIAVVGRSCVRDDGLDSARVCI